MLEAAEDVAARTVRGAAQQEVGEDLLVAVRVQRVAAILGQTDKRGRLWVYWPSWDRQTNRVGCGYTGHSGTDEQGGFWLQAILGQTGEQGGLWVLAILGQTGKQVGCGYTGHSGTDRQTGWVVGILAILGQRAEQGRLWVYWPFWDRQANRVGCG